MYLPLPPAHQVCDELRQHFNDDPPISRLQNRIDRRQMLIEAYINDAAAHRDHSAEIRSTGFVLHVYPR